MSIKLFAQDMWTFPTSELLLSPTVENCKLLFFDVKNLQAEVWFILTEKGGITMKGKKRPKTSNVDIRVDAETMLKSSLL